MPSLHGTVHKYGANADTDVIIPARYPNLTQAEEWARHCLGEGKARLKPDVHTSSNFSPAGIQEFLKVYCIIMM